MESAIKTQISGNLKTILAANTEALRAWVATMKSQAELLAEDPVLRGLVVELVKVPEQGGATQAALLSAPQDKALRARLKPVAEGRGFNGYVVLSTNFLILASGREQIIGMQSPPGYVDGFNTAWKALLSSHIHLPAWRSSLMPRANSARASPRCSPRPRFADPTGR